MTDPDPAGILTAVAADTGNANASALILKTLLMITLVLVNGFFSCSEIAVLSLNDKRIDKLADEGSKKAKKVKKLTSNSSQFLSTIQIGVTLAGFFMSASAAQTYAPLVAQAIVNAQPAWQAHSGGIETAAFIVITLFVSYLSLVFGELVPKKIAMAKPEKIATAFAPVLLAVSAIAKPFVKLLAASTNGVLRLIGVDPNADNEQVTEEEIRMLVDEGEEKGVIEDTQREMINNIFELDDVSAGEIMTHRVDMTAVEADEPVRTVIDAAIEDGYSRIPVYDDDPDNIVGIVYVKDLLRFIGSGIPKNTSIRDVMRESYFVPESKKCGDLFKEMTEHRLQMCVVVDEYGGTAGIVTVEDILESIVGDIDDEYDDDDEEISKINDNVYTVDGVTDIDEVSELIGVELPEGDYNTLGGFLMAQLGYIPQNGGEEDVVEYKNLKFTVLGVDERRIDKVRIEILPEPQPENDTEEEKHLFNRKDKSENE
ncbi:MAG: HlyC/CorC family transporter [Clostridia bacterium]|nr:HlyC/CorC family transporter [Clostridia bacterium]